MKAYVEHKKARFDYEIQETYVAGIDLRGFEVKAIKSGKGSLEGAHVSVRGGEAFLLNASIPPYQPQNTPKTYNPSRNRRLLLTKKEIQELAQAEGTKGLTIIPLKLYNKNNLVKVEIAVVQQRKKHDKRNVIKERDTKREVERTLKNL